MIIINYFYYFIVSFIILLLLSYYKINMPKEAVHYSGCTMVKGVSWVCDVPIPMVKSL